MKRTSLIEGSDHARFPVVRGGLAEILGIVNARALLSRVVRGRDADLTQKLEAPL